VRGVDLRFGVQFWPAVLAAMASLTPEARAADAVFDAEFWESAADVERVVDLDACEDSIANQRRAVRSTAATNVVSYELRVGDIADAGDYQIWARVRIPESSLRTMLVGQDVGGSFSVPQDSFVVQSGAGESGYRWLRMTRQGSGTADAPDDDPWLTTLTESPSNVEIRFLDDDIFVDRFAVSNAGVYSPPTCPPYVPSDGGPVHGDDDDWLPGARDAGCESPQYFDVSSGACVTPTERGCVALAGSPWIVLLLCVRRRRG
jgi:hypothetical protein